MDFIEAELQKRERGASNSNNWKGATLTDTCMHAYEWLITDLLLRTDERVASKVKHGQTGFWARKQSEHFYAQTMAIAYGEVCPTL